MNISKFLGLAAVAFGVIFIFVVVITAILHE